MPTTNKRKSSSDANESHDGKRASQTTIDLVFPTALSRTRRDARARGATLASLAWLVRRGRLVRASADAANAEHVQPKCGPTIALVFRALPVARNALCCSCRASTPGAASHTGSAVHRVNICFKIHWRQRPARCTCNSTVRTASLLLALACRTHRSPTVQGP